MEVCDILRLDRKGSQSIREDAPSQKLNFVERTMLPDLNQPKINFVGRTLLPDLNQQSKYIFYFLGMADNLLVNK
jgi:hypothetical protein